MSKVARTPSLCWRSSAKDEHVLQSVRAHRCITLRAAWSIVDAAAAVAAGRARGGRESRDGGTRRSPVIFEASGTAAPSILCVRTVAGSASDRHHLTVGFWAASRSSSSHGVMASPQRRALRERPWDLFYFVYFIFHILVFLFIDGQNFYPPRLVPRALGAIVDDYLTRSSDPFVLALRAGDRRYLWFTTSMWSSLVFQNPVFVAGAWCLWYGGYEWCVMRSNEVAGRASCQQPPRQS